MLIETIGGIPKRPTGADCKSVVFDFTGSNPVSPTLLNPSFSKGLHDDGNKFGF